MKSIIKTILIIIILFVTGLASLTAQDKKPKVRLDQAKVLGAPPAPVLQEPSNKNTVDGCCIKFEWQAGQGTPTNATYRVYVWEQGKWPNHPSTQVFPPKAQPGTSAKTLEVSLPSSLLNKKLYWNVEACAPALVQSRFGGKTSLACTFAQSPQELTWKFSPPGLGLQSPLTAPTNNLFFYWGPELPCAEYYVCISKPGIACPTPPRVLKNQNTIVARGFRAGAAQIDISQFSGQTVHWTVGAKCRKSNTFVYQQNVKIVHVP